MNLRTARLVLRDFRPDDLPAMREIDADAEVLRFEREPFSVAETAHRLSLALASQTDEPRTYYRLAVTIPPEDRLRGWIILKLSNGDIHEYEMGWTIHRQEWGQGYAGEGARALLDFAFARLHAHRVVAFCHADNQASMRVMENVGMQREGLLRETRHLNGRWCDELVYAILERDFHTGK